MNVYGTGFAGEKIHVKHSSPLKEQGKLSTIENDTSSMLETDKVAFSGVEKKTIHSAENEVSNLASIRRPGEGDL